MGITKKFLEEQGLTPEQVNAIFSERGKEITEEKAKLDEKEKALQERDGQLKELNEKIAAFDGTDVKLKELTTELDSYKQKEQERVKQEAEAKSENEYKERFGKLVGENKWKHPDVETGRYNAFKQELLNEANKGKGDADIFEAITKDLDCFMNPQQETIIMKGKEGQGEKKPDFKSFF